MDYWDAETDSDKKKKDTSGVKPYDTVCRESPACCEPREIKHVAFDADDTIWHIEPYGIASNMTGKLTLIDENTLEVEESYHSYDYGQSFTPKKPPSFKKKKRPWAIEHEAYLKSLWEQAEDTIPETGLPAPLSREAELETIKHELADYARTLKSEPQEEVNLEDITGWSTEQETQVSNLLDRYGNGVCKIVDVLDNASIRIKCRDNLWVLTADGFLFGDDDMAAMRTPPQKPLPTYTPSYETTAVIEKPYEYKPRKTIIKLFPTFRETLGKLKDNGISTSIISLNAPGTVKRLLEAFGLAGEFTDIKDTWDNKGDVFEKIAKSQGLCPCNMMFLDDNYTNTSAVSKKCGLALQIGPNKDIVEPIEIFRYIKVKSGQ